MFLEDLLNVFCIEQFDDLQDSLFSLLASYDIPNQSGVPLDTISRFVGNKVRSNDVAQYRALILGQAASNVVTGTANDIDMVARIILGETAVTKAYPTSIWIEFEGSMTSEERDIYKSIFQNCLPAGVKLIGVYNYDDDSARYDVDTYNNANYS